MRPVGRSGDQADASGSNPRYASGQGSPDVSVNRRACLRVGDPVLDDRGNYRNGEATVLVNGQAVVGQGHDASCDRVLAEGSPNVVVGQGRIASPGVEPGILYHIHVDADRDGQVDDDHRRNGTWEAGRGRYGAVLPVNADDDAIAPRPDVGGIYAVPADTRTPVEDYKKPGRTLAARDLSDVAHIDIRRDPRTAGRSTAGWKVVVRVSRRHKIRIFDRRTAGAREIIGPGTDDVHEITALSRDRYEWAMEGTQFAGPWPFAGADPEHGLPVYDGTVVITLEMWDPQGVKAHEEQCVVRASPWTMFTHFDPTDEVLVVGAENNEAVLDGLREVTGPAGVKLTLVGLAYDDRWMQDVMEPGFSALARNGRPATEWSKPIVLRSARHRQCDPSEEPDIAEADLPPTDLSKLPRLMCGPDFGYAQGTEPTYEASSLDSFGNLECTPPFVKGTSHYRFGRIVYGTNSPDIPRIDGPGMQADMVAFLNAQRVQSPIPIETGWLNVGHVDEILSFIPLRGSRLGFKVTVASPRLGVDILRRVVATSPAATMRWLHPANRNGTFDPHRSIAEILQLPKLQALTDFVEERITRCTTRLMTEIGLTADDLIRLPVVFTARDRVDNCHVANPDVPYGRRVSATPAFDNCIAQTPGVVNGLVLTRGEPTLESERRITYLMPKPYGPQVAGRCAFEDYIRSALGPSGTTGVTCVFADDFFSYHSLAGEVHCGTNSVRKPPVDRFWWEQDVV